VNQDWKREEIKLIVYEAIIRQGCLQGVKGMKSFNFLT